MATKEVNLGSVRGPQGAAATVTVGKVTTGAAGSNAAVTNSGTSGAAILNFTIPRGATGAQGTPTTVNGKSGASITLSAGDVGAYTKAETDGRIPGANLLDNSDFTNPVNQRKVSGAISTAGYFLDRWKLVSGTVTVSGSSVQLAAGAKIAQILEKAAGTARASVGTSSGTATAAYDNASKTFIITASTACTLSWAKLEKGSVATPWQARDPAAELLACQRYYVPIGENTKFFGGIGTAGNVAFVGMILPVQMRVTPSFTSDLNVVLRTVQGEQNIHGPVISKMTENNLAFTVTLNSGTTKSTPCAGYFYNERGLSADL